LFDLVADPNETHNLLFDPAEASRPEVAARFAELKAEISRLQKQLGDDGRYADAASLPKDDVDGPFEGREPLGTKTVAEAIAAAAPLP
jgi:uncharacterized small protein (DUF1192 family)